ncbi:hypothetical protein HDV06_000586 [Boothiomyces sp. JEL0866]|nr:hypothetical protein HDV06_000586 [Boothiomyces sp. JEL0866]
MLSFLLLSALALADSDKCVIQTQSILSKSVQQQINVPVNFSVSFAVTPLGTLAPWSNILHFSTDNQDMATAGSRLLGIWFSPGTTQLYIRMGCTSSTNGGIVSSALPINQTSKVELQFYGKTAYLSINKTITQIYPFPSDRPSGSSYFYMSDPWYVPANVQIGNYQLKEIDFLKHLKKPHGTFQISQAFRGLVTVPVNYSLSFEFTPINTIPSWGSVAHYTSDNNDMSSAGSRMPGIWTTPGTSQLYFRFGTTTNSNGGFTSAALPFNQTSKIRLQVLGNNVFYSVNGTVTQVYILDGVRSSGPAYFYLSDPWYAPANALIGHYRLKEINHLRDMNMPTGTFQLSEGYRGQVNVPNNFSVSFDITPLGSVASWSSIAHYTVDDADMATAGSRMLAIWFTPGTTQLYIRMGSSGSPNGGITTAALPINQVSSIEIQIMGSMAYFALNGSIIQVYPFQGDRPTGLAYFYMTDPWYVPANAMLSNYKLKELDSLDDVSLPNGPFQITQGYRGQVNVPVNFAITFDVTPIQAVASWASVAHYTADNTDMSTSGSRMPGIWFYPGTSQLYIRIGSSATNDGGITTLALPFRQTSSIGIQVIDSTMYYSVNGTIAQIYLISGTRPSGLAYFYLSDPWYAPANALINNYNMVSADNLIGDVSIPSGSFALSTAYKGQVTVPTNYNLQFSITPKGIVSPWSNIVHFTADNMDMSTPGSRMPGIWFQPGSTSLYIRVGSDQSSNGGLTTAALPLNSKTAFKLTAQGNVINVYLNGTLSSSYTAPGTRVSGSAYLYISDPWYAPANAILESFAFTPQ